VIRRLLDTSACVELVRGRSDRILARLRSCPLGSVGLSTITLAELCHGAEKSSDPGRNRLALTQFCAPLEILPFDDRAALSTGEVRSRLERAGGSIGPLDTLIAGHALALSAVLVTDNERVFRRVAGLRVENWARP
jgi:tRNA(fMet)-specific endonuclease VapC